MTYSYVLRPQAQNEYEDSFIWYLDRSLSTAENFINQIQNTFDLLCENPFLGKCTYRNVYELRVKKFPFNIVYFIEEANNQIVVVSIFHDKRNPKKKFDR